MCISNLKKWGKNVTIQCNTQSLVKPLEKCSRNLNCALVWAIPITQFPIHIPYKNINTILVDPCVTDIRRYTYMQQGKWQMKMIEKIKLHFED